VATSGPGEIPFLLAKYKRPRRWKPGPVTKEENAAPHHVRDSTIKAFRSFKANLRAIHVISLAAGNALARTL
jgi:hypothetical protein